MGLWRESTGKRNFAAIELEFCEVGVPRSGGAVDSVGLAAPSITETPSGNANNQLRCCRQKKRFVFNELHHAIRVTMASEIPNFEEWTGRIFSFGIGNRHVESSPDVGR